MPYQPLAVDQTEVLHTPGPDSFARPGAPVGQLVEIEWNSSAVRR